MAATRPIAPPNGSRASSSTSTSARSSQHGTPVFITIWDLCPPSIVASSAYRLLGLGVFHTNLWLPDLSVEYAFGGHGYADISGIFAIPRDPIDAEQLILARKRSNKGKQASSESQQVTLPATLDGISWLGPEAVPCPGPSPIPNARFMGAWFMGYAGPPSPSQVSSDSMPSASSPSSSTNPSATQTVAASDEERYLRWAAPQTGAMAFKEPLDFTEPFFLPASSSPGSSNTETATSSAAPLASTASGSTARHPRHARPRLTCVNHALQTLQSMRNDRSWAGTEYDLLSRNCNHFTDLACRALIGVGIPGWINRSAALGKSVMWAVPKSLLDLDTGVQVEEWEEVEAEHDDAKNQDGGGHGVVQKLEQEKRSGAEASHARQ